MIFIDNIPSLRDPDSITYTFDDRIQKVPLINGNTVQDYGNIDSGAVISISAIFSIPNYLLIKNLWINRTLVTFDDGLGFIIHNCRLVFKSIKRERLFPNFVTLNFELWRC